ncbi:S-adenosyl-L-methionine-dependent methyltransferase [Xylona heveae TC161]|uniref:S-adenosyl-L-methionine-dependent methyltransferase n=1 Tax=Xylona heveae (strain CBS 132557 / TC161) TaxID=1328760 RepID=A0A165HEY3_XYLHT|nr:S-adenosyl-L-methionine-dependent methyltransferase [Xylona heveae TC161]KZF23410.1 S-adenosyl-L-methionine-dependent methyltransferase [Xylona heveae TC161]
MEAPRARSDIAARVQDLASQLFDAAKAYQSAPGEPDQNVRRQISITARQIASLTEDPMQDALRLSSEMVLMVALRSLMTIGVFENMPSEGSIAPAELAYRTGAEEALLIRLMRVPVSMGVFEQTPENHYARTSKTESYLGSAGSMFETMMDNFLAIMVKFPKYLEHFGFKEPVSQTESPVCFAENALGEDPWSVISKDPKRIANFNKTMQAQDSSMPMIGIYDFSNLLRNADVSSNPDRPLFVDVGGNRGHVIKAVLETYPEFSAPRMVLQDRPVVIQEVEELGELPGVVKMAHNFLDPQPVKGAVAYYFRRIMHDWSDADCRTILKQIAAVMAPDSKVLISETIVPEKCDGPNLMAAWMDLVIMSLGGKERTEENWYRLVQSAGLRITKICRAAIGPQAVIEAQLA